MRINGKAMARRYTIYNIVLALLLLVSAVSCRSIELPEQSVEVPEGYVKIDFKAAPDGFDSVAVRAVDPDGLDIQNLTLFCFSNYGLFITTVNATLLTTHSTKGTFTAVIPEETHRIHFIANQNSNLYDEEKFRGKGEADVLAAMEGASGMMIYWARFEKDESLSTTISEQLTALPNGVQLLRNQAKVSIANWNNDYLIVKGFVTTNRQAFGTVAPFHPEEGFVWPGSEPFVTMPSNMSLLSDITDIDTKSEDYIFESENDSENPISVIIKGHLPGSTEELYYRIVLIDDNGDRILIRRNHSYVINIVGKLSYGQPTFEQALSAPASNNVWVSVDSWVNEIEDDNYILSVDKTYVVLDESEAGTTMDLHYTVTPKGGAAMSDAEVRWTGTNTVANHTFADKTFDTSTGEGKITIQLLPMTNATRQQGTLLIKKGRLQRTVDIIVIKTQLFTPSWVGTQIFGGTTGEFVTLKFTVPESCPEELYPFDVLISVNSLDIRAASGMSLPVVRKGEPDYGEYDNEYGYKYIYTVTKPGAQRLYFHTILTHADGESQNITIEAKYFETLTKTFTFTNKKRAITVEGLNVYQPVDDNYFADDEAVYYYLVPQKRNAPVTFDMQMIDKSTGEAINAGVNDEFLVYSKTLDFYGPGEGHDDHESSLFYNISEEYWSQSTNGRVMMFMVRDPIKEAPYVGQYTIHLKTNRAVSEDIVRLSSNQSSSYSALPVAAGEQPKPYTGNSYRSAIFELANYNPFRFGALVNGQGEYATEGEEVESDLVWSYEPNQSIDISFDITSFKGTDGKSVDPFGESFEVYIDAPMLRLDPTRFIACKINEDKIREISPGRFVYTVDADRDTERTFGTGSALLADATGANQAGERKTIPFKTKVVTSAGTIAISSNKEKVVFYDKQFKVTNELISGVMKYNDGTKVANMPAYSFVAFARTSDGVRIGRVTVLENGVYTLNLRAEYSFNWYTDPIEFDYIDSATGTVYHYHLSSLDELFRNPDITLTVSSAG